MRKILCLLICVYVFCSVFTGMAAADQEKPDGMLRMGMSIKEVEAIWGEPAGTDTHTRVLRWYEKDGHTLICGFSWCNLQQNIWYNGRQNADDVWGLAEWIEFDGRRACVGGTIPKEDTVWKAMYQVLSWNEIKYNHLPLEEQSRIRIHEIGSGASYAAKITGDGWIVEEDFPFVNVIPCLGQSGWIVGIPVLLAVLALAVCLILALIRIIKSLRRRFIIQ